jgi:hypothetical protein
MPTGAISPNSARSAYFEQDRSTKERTAAG